MTRTISKTEWALWLFILLSLAWLLAGCGTQREEVQHQERQDQTTTKTTAVSEVTKPNGAGALALVESTKVTTYTEQIAKGTTDAQISATTTIQAPEVKSIVTGAAAIVAPGFGGIIGSAMSWLVGTPEGAATGLSLATLAAGLVKRGISGEIDLRKKDRHLKAIVKGNSDFMQAHPEHADKLKDAQRSAQADPELKNAIKKARVDQGLA